VDVVDEEARLHPVVEVVVVVVVAVVVLNSFCVLFNC
jgi:hypothetical protein